MIKKKELASWIEDVEGSHLKEVRLINDKLNCLQDIILFLADKLGYDITFNDIVTVNFFGEKIITTGFSVTNKNIDNLKQTAKKTRVNK